jgi:hypothetical protein
MMSGATACQSLETIDISENPIGEKGAKAVITATSIRGASLKVEMKGCALKSEDETCWFDRRFPFGSYTLFLDKPYDRAVFLEILHLAAYDDDCNITDLKYYPFINANAQDICLELQRRPRVVREYSTQISEETKSHDFTEKGIFKSIEKKGKFEATDLTNVRKLFRLFDTDNSNALDRSELWRLLLKLELNENDIICTLDRLFAEYDTDGSGQIEEEEFIAFISTLQLQARQAHMAASEERYFAQIESREASRGGGRRSSLIRDTDKAVRSSKLEPYKPPELGSLKFTFSTAKISSTGVKQQSSDVRSLLNATSALADSITMYECIIVIMATM